MVEEIIQGYLADIEIDVWSVGEVKRPSTEQQDVRRKIGSKIAYLRQINSLSQKKLGQVINVDQQTVSDIELGKRKLDIVEAVAIAQILGVELSEII
ncbi:MAG: helix-turn-helix transcriptional regulator [Cyanobacteriota bacterium]